MRGLRRCCVSGESLGCITRHLSGDFGFGCAGRAATLQRAAIRSLAAFLVCLSAAGLLRAAEYPAPASGEFVIRDFHFQAGETLPELRIHYRALGKPQRGPSGAVTNAVIILH